MHAGALSLTKYENEKLRQPAKWKVEEKNNSDNLHTPLKTRRASHIGTGIESRHEDYESRRQCDLFISNNWCNKCDPIHIHGKKSRSCGWRMWKKTFKIAQHLCAARMRISHRSPWATSRRAAVDVCVLELSWNEREKEKFAWAGISALRRMSEQKRRCDKTLLIICIMLKFQEKELFFTLFPRERFCGRHKGGLNESSLRRHAHTYLCWKLNLMMMTNRLINSKLSRQQSPVAQRRWCYERRNLHAYNNWENNFQLMMSLHILSRSCIFRWSWLYGIRLDRRTTIDCVHSAIPTQT